jgi:hypothetical protein
MRSTLGSISRQVYKRQKSNISPVDKVAIFCMATALSLQIHDVMLQPTYDSQHSTTAFLASDDAVNFPYIVVRLECHLSCKIVVIKLTLCCLHHTLSVAQAHVNVLRLAHSKEHKASSAALRQSHVNVSWLRMSDKEIVLAAVSKLNVTCILESYLEFLLDWRLSLAMTRWLSSSCPDQMVFCCKAQEQIQLCH